MFQLKSQYNNDNKFNVYFMRHRNVQNKRNEKLWIARLIILINVSKFKFSFTFSHNEKFHDKVLYLKEKFTFLYIHSRLKTINFQS